MTGYGTAEVHKEKYSVKVEIKALNGKYLDINLKIPRFLIAKEIEIRNTFGKLIERGSASFLIHIIKHKISDNEIQINESLAKQYYAKLKSLSEELNAPAHDIFRITTGMNDVIYQDHELLDPELYLFVLEVGKEAFKEFDEFRKREGYVLAKLLESYAKSISAGIPRIEELEPERIQTTKERLQKKLSLLTEDEGYDKNRFEQELIYYLEKLDVSEEKNRLQEHCSHFLDALANNPKGKSLNFVAQEMGREINTLGSKANHPGIQKEVIAMKENLEKIKEQVLNLL